MLFNRTVHENIALADPAMPRAMAHAAARGANLSGGQRQRIAIARALATRPRILILDEATSALDYESERIIQANMRAICKGRTVIIIAHRLVAVKDCDRIISLSDGRIVEDGPHRELLRIPNGLYARLWRMQLENAESAPCYR
jgi:subfamily B ATP-binding cassette protein HlyB/CyaB